MDAIVLQQAIENIDSAQHILILPSSPVDGDSLGSALALYSGLKSLGKQATVVLSSPVPEIYQFLPNVADIQDTVDLYNQFIIHLNLQDQIIDDIQHEIQDGHVNIVVTPKAGRFKPEDVSFPKPHNKYDLLVTLDCADLTQLGDFYNQHHSIFEEVPSLNIDHHISNKNYAKVNLVDATYSSTTHMLYEIF